MGSRDDYSGRHVDFAAAIDADQVELRAMQFGSASVEEGLRDNAVYGDDELADEGGPICESGRSRPFVSFPSDWNTRAR